MKKSRISNKILVFVIAAMLVVGLSSFSFAATSLRKVNYAGSGNVEIYLAKKTSYGNMKVTAKDNEGVSYQTKITSKSKSGLKFKIYNYKTGRAYKLVISGYKGGNINASMSIISKKKAISTAKRKAKSLGATKFNNVNAESTVYRNTGAWRVSFDSNGSKYMYLISQQTGMVLGGGKK